MSTVLDDHLPLHERPTAIVRLGGLVFGVFAYLAFLASFLLLLAFLVDLPQAPYAIDRGGHGLGAAAAALVDLALVTAFALQHSVMARSGFKAWLTRRVPRSTERSVYVLVSSVVLTALCALWQPLPAVLWQAGSPLAAGAMWAVFGVGVVVVLVSTFLIDHFDLFGLRQSLAGFLGRHLAEPGFVTPWLYRIVRHPLYVGWILTFFGTPLLTVGHLLFAAAMTAYILVAIRFEERDLVARHGVDYLEYRRRVPMLVPGLATARD